MAYSVPRSVVDAFYEAYVTHDTERLAPLLHDDIEWTISGPVDVLSFCGVRRGKAAVLELAGKVVPGIYRVINFTQHSILVDGNRAASLNRMSGRRCSDGRTISYRLAHFMQFEDGLVLSIASLIDSFDAVEQMLGHPLSVHDEQIAPRGDLVAV